MLINPINNINNINNKGIPIADFKVRGVDASYKLYSINHKDKSFLARMYKSIDLKKLMPNLKDHDYIMWDAVIDTAIKRTNSADNISLLETCNDVPCGILNYKDINNRYNLNYVATFPVKAGEKVPFAGQIIFNEFFNRFLNSDKKNIELYAIKKSYFDPVSKYLGLGFRMMGGDNNYEKMVINKERAKQTLLKQKEFIGYTPIKTSENIDLNEHINLNYIT